MSGSKPIGLCQRQGIIALGYPGLCFSQRCTGIVERSLRIGDCVGRLPYFLRITCSLRRCQLLLSGLKRRLILTNRLVLKLPLLDEHVHLRGQTLNRGFHVLNAHSGQSELTLGLCDVTANGSNGGLCVGHRIGSGVPAVIRQRQLIAARLQLSLRVLHSGVGIVQRCLSVRHGLRRLIDALRIVCRLRRRQLHLGLGENAGILRHCLILQVQLLGEHIGARG